MTNKFSDFLNTEQKVKEDVKQNQNNNNNININNSINNAFTQEEQKSYEDLINKYSTYSQEELMDEFLKLSKQRKNSGELNNNTINNISETLNPYLTEDQKDNMRDLLNKIR